MTYQVLARKWRPQIFANVVGQEHVLMALTNSLSLGRIHHAYLFSGTRGVGKTSIARILAKSFSCKNGITSSPCSQCNNCIEIENGSFVDLIEIDAASRTKVEDTRDLLDNVQYSSVYGRFKIYLIDEVHMLSKHSFNALLKTLEEPPSHVKFFLVTTDPQKIPDTIVSRCLQFHLKVLDIEQIQKQLLYILHRENITFETSALNLLARAAEGSMRDALNLTDQAISIGNGNIERNTVVKMLGILDDEQSLTMIETLIKGHGEHLLFLLNQAASRGVDWDTLLIEILRLLHYIAMEQIVPNFLNNIEFSQIKRLKLLARVLQPSDIQLYYQILLMGRKDLPLAPTQKIGVEMTLLRTLAFHPQVMATEPVKHSNVISKSNNLQQNTELLPCSMKIQEKIISNDELISGDNYQNTSFKIDNISNSIHKLLQVQTQLLYQGISKIEENSLLQQVTRKVEEKDLWTTQINSFTLPKLVRQMALNTWKEICKEQEKVILHLRSNQKHLNSESARQILESSLSNIMHKKIKLTIIEDDNLTILTPLEWYRFFYKEELLQARQLIKNDIYIQKLIQLFDADLDEDSILLI